MAGMYPGSMADMYGGGRMKSSVNTDADSTSSGAGMNFNDYDDESGNYYMRKSAARRHRYAATQAAASGAGDGHDYDSTLSRADEAAAASQDNSDGEEAASEQRREYEKAHFENREQILRDHLMNIAVAGAHAVDRANSEMMMLAQEEERLSDHDYNDGTAHHGASNAEHIRTKRQVYYQSGYNGKERCHGFPLEINVRSRVKMDRLFPIHGNSQIKKCIPVG